MNSDYQPLPAEIPQPQKVTLKQRALWGATATIYLGGILLNLAIQDSENLKKYPFELTIIGGWFTLIQHAFCHPYTPLSRVSIPRFLLPLTHRVKNCEVHTIERCVDDPTYTPKEGFSNLTLNLEILIAVLYWSLGAAVGAAKTSGIVGVNSIMMHGVLSLLLAIDCTVNQRPFHLRRTLINTSLFLVLGFAPWHSIGQAMIGESILSQDGYQNGVSQCFTGLWHSDFFKLIYCSRN